MGVRLPSGRWTRPAARTTRNGHHHETDTSHRGPVEPRRRRPRGAAGLGLVLRTLLLQQVLHHPLLPPVQRLQSVLLRQLVLRWLLPHTDRLRQRPWRRLGRLWRRRLGSVLRHAILRTAKLRRLSRLSVLCRPRAE